MSTSSTHVFIGMYIEIITNWPVFFERLRQEIRANRRRSLFKGTSSHLGLFVYFKLFNENYHDSPCPFWLNTFVVSRAFITTGQATQETPTPPEHLVSPLLCRGPWIFTVVLYCWCHSDSASVLLYFTLDKKEDLAKAPISLENEKVKKQHKVVINTFDYTTIADQLRLVSWSNYCHPTGVVKPVYVICRLNNEFVLRG